MVMMHHRGRLMIDHRRRGWRRRTVTIRLRIAVRGIRDQNTPDKPCHGSPFLVYRLRRHHRPGSHGRCQACGNQHVFHRLLLIRFQRPRNKTPSGAGLFNAHDFVASSVPNIPLSGLAPHEFPLKNLTLNQLRPLRPSFPSFPSVQNSIPPQRHQKNSRALSYSSAFSAYPAVKENIPSLEPSFSFVPLFKTPSNVDASSNTLSGLAELAPPSESRQWREELRESSPKKNYPTTLEPPKKIPLPLLSHSSAHSASSAVKKNPATKAPPNPTPSSFSFVPFVQKEYALASVTTPLPSGRTHSHSSHSAAN